MGWVVVEWEEFILSLKRDDLSSVCKYHGGSRSLSTFSVFPMMLVYFYSSLCTYERKKSVVLLTWSKSEIIIIKKI